MCFYLAEYEVMCIYKDLQKDSPNTSRGLSETEFLKLYQCLGLKWQMVIRIKVNAIIIM